MSDEIGKNDRLNKTLEELKGTSDAQSVVLKQTQAQLNEVQQKYEQNHRTLSEHIEEPLGSIGAVFDQRQNSIVYFQALIKKK